MIRRALLGKEEVNKMCKEWLAHHSISSELEIQVGENSGF